MTPRNALSGAALAIAAALALGLPPEVHPESGVLVTLLLGTALALRPRGVSLPVVLGGLVLAGLQLAVSYAPSATLGSLIAATLGLAAFSAGRALPESSRRPLLLALATVGGGLAVLAIVQRFGLMEWQAAWARSIGAAEAIVYRLEHGRPFATHVVPAALAGALLVSAAALVGAWPARRRAIGLAALGALLAVGFLLTGSLGGLLGLVAGAAVLLAPHVARWSLGRKLAALLTLAVLGAALLVMRPVNALDLSREDNPLRLRAGNWRGAVLVAPRGGVTGIGFGAYASLYPSVRRGADSETRFAHNSWLQLGVEGGLPVLLLLGAAGWALWRRSREPLSLAERAALAGGVAWIAHNCVDFTAYLPGVTIPLLALLGTAFPKREAEDAERPLFARAAAFTLALALALGVVWWGGEALAQRHLERAELTEREGRPQEAVELAAKASFVAPWSVRVGTAAHDQLQAAGAGGAGLASRIAGRLVAMDPESPASWRRLGATRLAQHRPTDAWRAYEQAALRHPADPHVRETIAALEASFERVGLFEGELAWGDERPQRAEHAWTGWDDLLLLLAGALVPLLAWRWWKGGGAPAPALALAGLVVLGGFGEGGALPGARLARALLILVALAAALWPRREKDALPLLPPGAAWLAALLAWAGLAAALAPAGHAARDGLSSVLAVLAVGALSWALARGFPAWPRVAAALLVGLASLHGGIWVIQQGLRLAGVALDTLPVPLHAWNTLRPAADFLHPGHLGTLFVAAGLALAARAWHASRWAGLAPAALFVLAGLWGGGRAPLVALAAGGLLLALSLTGRSRRIALVALAVAAALGVSAVALRFAEGTPHSWSRPGIWAASLEALGERPVTGYGAGGFAPLAGAHAFEDPGEVARFGRSFRGPHSDLLGLFLAWGIPGGLLALGLLALALRPARAVWRRETEPSERAALAALYVPLAALGAHALVDDLFSERPSLAVLAALLVGAGLAFSARQPAVRAVGRAGRGAVLAIAVLVFVGVELVPWAADRLARSGRPALAARLEARNPRYQRALSRMVGGPADKRLAYGLVRNARALAAADYDPASWDDRARLLEAACRGPLAERATCQAADDAWSALIARRPLLATMRRQRAHARLGRGQTEEALTGLALAVRLEPAYLAARLDIVRLLLELGRRERAALELAALEEMLRELEGVRPKTNYERTLLRFDPAELAELRERLKGRPE